MNRNNTRILLTTLWLLLILNFFSLESFYYNYSWKELFNKWLYIDSSTSFEKAWNIQWTYNKANSLYKNSKYNEAIKEYLSILWKEEININFLINNNIANSYYRLWEIEEDKIKSWEEAVEYYNKALDIKYNDETKENLEFVLNKIKEEKEKKENKDEEKKDNKKSEESNQEDWEKWEEKNENKENKTDSWSTSEDDKKEEEKKWEWEEKKWTEKSEGEGNENKISEEQEDALKQYEKALKQAEQENQDWFNKVYQENSNNTPFDIFNDPFFNNDLLDNKSWEKDW